MTSPDRRFLAALLTGALLLRFAALGRADLWTDEIQTLHAIELSAGDEIAERLRAGHPPVYFLLLKAWTALFGTSQFALRAPAALFGTALLVPAWSLFRRFLDPLPAKCAVVFLALHPLFVELSREARMYSLLGLLFLVLADGAAASLTGRAPRWHFWLAAAAGPFVHPTWGFATLALFAWIAVERRGAAPDAASASRRVLAGIGVSLLLLVGGLLLASPQHQELTRRPWLAEIGVFVVRLVVGTRFPTNDPWIVGLVAGLWCVVPVVGFARAEPRVRRFALIVGLGTCVMSVSAGLIGGVPWGPSRYVHLAVLGLVVLAGVGASRLRPSVALAAGCILLIATAGNFRPGLTAWSTAAERLRDERDPVVVPDESSRMVLAHYLGRDVAIEVPPAGAVAWWRATLVVEGTRRGVALAREPAPR